MTYGKFLIINLDAASPSILTSHHGDDKWPTDKIFDYTKWLEPENMQMIVRDAENKDMMGNKGFQREETFALAFWTRDEECATALLKAMPEMYRNQFFKACVA